MEEEQITLGYLLVITKVEKRPFLCSSKFGPVSHSTKIPSEKTKTRPASTIEETRCWRREKWREKRISEKENGRGLIKSSVGCNESKDQTKHNEEETEKLTPLQASKWWLSESATQSRLPKMQGHYLPVPWASHCLLF